MSLTRAQFTELALAAQADPQPLIENACWVATKRLPGQAPVARLQFNRAQRKLHAALMAQRQAGKPPRGIVCKARQPGISTQLSGYVTATALTMPYSQSMQVAHLEDPTIGLFNKIKFMVDNLPRAIQPVKGTDRRNELVLDRIKCADGDVALKSSILVATAGGGEPWLSRTLQTVHLSEFARFPYASDTFVGIIQCVPLSPQSLVVIESTANGVGNCFHEEWEKAVGGESGFVPIFIGWWEIDEYRMTCPPDFELDSEEKQLKRALGLTNEQLQWRRYILFTQCRGNVDLFNQDYPDSPQNAFLLSGRPAFNIKKLREMYDTAKKVVPMRGVVALKGDNEGAFTQIDRGPLAVWRVPEEGHDYSIGGDPSSGVEPRSGEMGDPACIQVFDRTLGEMVATWHGYANPVVFARIMLALGYWYNTAILAPELTGGHGFSVVEELKMAQYPRIYVWQRVDRVRGGNTNFYGWETSYRTRPLLIDTFCFALNDDEVFIWDTETNVELQRFQWLGRAEASGGHDDRAMAAMIAYRVHLEMPLLSTGAPPRVKFTDSATAKASMIDEAARQARMANVNHQVWEEVDDEIDRLKQGARGSQDDFDLPDGLDDEPMGLEEVPEIPW